MIKKSVLLTALAIAGFALTTLAQTVPNYVPTNGLVGWWPFNGNAIDESINTNDGTVNGATLTTDRFGNVNNTYSFNGISDYIEVIHNSSLTFSNAVSYSFWINIPDYSFNTTGAPERNAIGMQRTSSSSGFQWETNDQIGTPGTPQFYLNDGSAVAQYEDITALNLNSWIHLVGTYDGTTLKLYSNNVLLGTSTGSLNLSSITQNLYFGKEGALGRFFKGKLDDIGIWNRALNQQEITGLYNANVCFQTITVTDTLLINTNITGFNPVTYQNTIKIWPNPTNDHITIDNGNLANLTGHQIKISNALGQQVFQSAITQQQFYVNMSTWGGNGIYFVNLINAQGVTIETRKIVLQ
jgi:hypothetical protein